MNKYIIKVGKDLFGCSVYQGFQFSEAEQKFYAYTDCYDCLSELIEDYKIFKDSEIIK